MYQNTHTHTHLHPVAYAKDGLPHGEDGGVKPGGIFCIHGGWPPRDDDRPEEGNIHECLRQRSEVSGSRSPVALLSDGEGRRLQREDLGADAQLAHTPVDHFAVLGSGIQDGHGPLARPILLRAADLQLWVQTGGGKNG